MERRDFLRRAALGGAAAALVPVMIPALARAQGSAPRDQGSGSAAAPVQGTTSNLFDMNQDAAKSVRRAPKAGARASLSADERDALEHDIRCQCGCTLDVYTCRTTDFSCQVSPAMHRDVISLVEGGYSAQEILDSFVSTYGEKALMAPRRQGFNLAGYVVPFAALGAGFVALIAVLRGMQRRTSAPAARNVASDSMESSGTTDELERLQAAIRRDE